MQQAKLTLEDQLFVGDGLPSSVSAISPLSGGKTLLHLLVGYTKDGEALYETSGTPASYLLVNKTERQYRWPEGRPIIAKNKKRA